MHKHKEASFSGAEETIIYQAPPSNPPVKPFSDTDEITLPIGYEFAGHRIESIVGIGGFGVVYAATDLALGRTVALKEYFPHSMAKRAGNGEVLLKSEKDHDTFQAGMNSFINEARLLAQFDHSSLVKVFQFWESHRTAYMTMSFVPGMTLKSQIDCHAFEPSEASLKAIMEKLAQALHVMHEHSCYHRDVSPDNVIMHEDTGLPVLLDFGAARQAIENHAHSFTVILKSGYAPVEQYSEVPGLSQGSWTDVYALGALVYKVITGQPPPSAVGRMVNDSIVRLAESSYCPTYSREFLQTIDAALAVMPEDRIQDMPGLLDRLKQTTLKHPDDKTKTTKRNQPFRFGKAGILTALILIGSGLIGVTVLDQQPDGIEQKATQAEIPKAAIDSVQAKLELTASNSTLVIEQDFLELEIKSSHSGYLSLFVQTSDGMLLQMLPKVGAKDFAIEANQSVRFPSNSEPLIASGPPGENLFLAVLTQDPIPEFSFPTQPYFSFSQISWTGSDLLGKLETQLRTLKDCNQPPCASALATSKIRIVERY